MSNNMEHTVIYKEAQDAPVSYAEGPAVVNFAKDDVLEFVEAVSYTHLTLPTKA